MRDLDRIAGWFRERFPRHPHLYFGLSGATLLHDALRSQRQEYFVLPAYICPSLSAMGLAAGKKLVHVEVDPRTMHPDADQLARENAIVLIDHAFGYPFPSIAEVRRPGTIVIEDCARALGVSIKCPCEDQPLDRSLRSRLRSGDDSIDPDPSRDHRERSHAASDWILFSMYKTIRGSRNGAVLLTNAPLPLTNETLRGATTIRERAATFAPARWLHHRILQRTTFGSRPVGPAPEYEPQHGLPSELCAARFWAELKNLEPHTRMRREIADELTEHLSQLDGIECARVAEGCATAGHFVSFSMQKGSRDRVITELYRQGLFVMRTWDIVPGDYESLQPTFPSPPSFSRELAARMAHVPIDYFLDSSARRRLIPALRDALRKTVH